MSFHETSHVRTQAAHVVASDKECICTVKSFLHAFFAISSVIFRTVDVCMSTLVLNNTYNIYNFEF